MIGPKQFDIHHKTKPKRDFDNPIVNKIFEPKFKYREKELKSFISSFINEIKPPSLKNIPEAKVLSFEDIHKGMEEKKEEIEITDEIINQITYKVFQNIKEYLDKDNEKSSSRKVIKLEIDL
jgi:hypothetical protein